MDNYDVLSFVGEGSFGRVFKAKHKEMNAIVALKVIRKKGRFSKDIKDLRVECDIQRSLNHPNIIRMIDSFDTDTELVVVTEFAEKELHSILAKEGCFDEEKAKRVTWDLVSALYYLHSHRVLHRDLKPQNVLMDSEGRAKLCDFGLSRIMTNATHILTSVKGTPLYMAPEVIDEKPYDHQADLWSLGCIVYELMAGQPPFMCSGILQLAKMIKHKPVQWPTFLTPDACSFLQGLLHKDPLKRLSWSEILEHPFVAGHVLIVQEDNKVDSPLTKPLSQSQQEAKDLQREKLSRIRKVNNRIVPRPAQRVSIPIGMPLQVPMALQNYFHQDREKPTVQPTLPQASFPIGVPVPAPAIIQPPPPPPNTLETNPDQNIQPTIQQNVTQSEPTKNLTREPIANKGDDAQNANQPSPYHQPNQTEVEPPQNITHTGLTPMPFLKSKLMQNRREPVNSNLKLRDCVGFSDERRNFRTMGHAAECVPLSDDDSVRAISAFSVRESLKTDDEDQSQPITAANAKLLRHEYNVMNNSNLVVCNLESNMAQLMVSTKKLEPNKMDKIVEEKHVVDKPAVEESKVNETTETKRKSTEIKAIVKSADTPNSDQKTSSKCSSDTSSGLSKSVPPSYKQKLLQFSRDKLWFASGGNRLTRSIKRSFHFSRSWDKNKSETQRRTSEPVVDTAAVSTDKKESVAFSKEADDEDSVKRDEIESSETGSDDKSNDRVKVEENKAAEPSSIELEEWEAFLNSNITEVMDGDVESLTQLNMVTMVIGVVGSAAKGARGGRVCGAVAALLALPALAHSIPRHTLLNIQDVYLEAKVVYNFVAAINTLMKNSNYSDDGVQDRLQGVSRMVEVCSWLCVRSCRGVRQFAAALAAHNAHPVFTRLLAQDCKSPRIVLNIVGLLITVLQDLPENADVVEKILFDDKRFNFLSILEQPNDALRLRVCILISLLCTFSCTALTNAMESKWTKKNSECLESLHTHCNVTLNRAARLASKEISNMPFYVS